MLIDSFFCFKGSVLLCGSQLLSFLLAFCVEKEACGSSHLSFKIISFIFNRLLIIQKGNNLLEELPNTFCPSKNLEIKRKQYSIESYHMIILNCVS